MFVVQLLMSLGQRMSDGVPLFHEVTQLNGCECISGNVPIFVYMLFAHHWQWNQNFISSPFNQKEIFIVFFHYPEFNPYSCLRSCTEKQQRRRCKQPCDTWGILLICTTGSACFILGLMPGELASRSSSFLIRPSAARWWCRHDNHNLLVYNTCINCPYILAKKRPHALFPGTEDRDGPTRSVHREKLMNRASGL